MKKLIVVTCLLGLFAQAHSQSLSCEEMKEKLALDVEIWNTGDLDRLSELYHPECQDEGLYSNLQERRSYAELVLQQNKNFKTEVNKVVCGDDEIWCTYSCSGFSEQYGVDFVVDGYLTIKFKDGKAWELSGDFNMLPALQEKGYTLMAPSATATISKNVLIGLHVLQLDMVGDATIEDYLKVYGEEVLPAYNSLFEGVTQYIAEGVRGDCANCFSTFMVMESEDVRNRYFDSNGEFTAETIGIIEQVAPLQKKLGQLGTSKSERKYTDWQFLSF